MIRGSYQSRVERFLRHEGSFTRTHIDRHSYFVNFPLTSVQNVRLYYDALFIYILNLLMYSIKYSTALWSAAFIFGHKVHVLSLSFDAVTAV